MDLSVLRVLEEYGLHGYKVASANLTNNELLEALSATGKPLIFSTEMSCEAEIKVAVQLLRNLGAPFSLLHYNSIYPTRSRMRDVNQSYLPKLRQITDALVGYSIHDGDIVMPIGAVALGERIIEKQPRQKNSWVVFGTGNAPSA